MTRENIRYRQTVQIVKCLITYFKRVVVFHYDIKSSESGFLRLLPKATAL